jgi:hypothetical protein
MWMAAPSLKVNGDPRVEITREFNPAVIDAVRTLVQTAGGGGKLLKGEVSKSQKLSAVIASQRILWERCAGRAGPMLDLGQMDETVETIEVYDRTEEVPLPLTRAEQGG